MTRVVWFQGGCSTSPAFTHFLVAFAKLRRATISFVMSVRLSSWNNPAPSGRILMKLDIWTFLSKIFRENPSFITSDKNKGNFTWRRKYIYDSISLKFQTKIVDNRNTNFMINNYFRKPCRLWDNALRMLGKVVWNTRNTDSRTSLSITLYVHCLSWL